MGEVGLLDAPEGAILGKQYSKQGSLLAAALVGQLLAFLLALAGLFSSLLVNKGVSLPAYQTVPNYALLALVYGGALLVRRQRPQNGLLSYAAVSLLDVEGNFLVVLAYRFTFITSVQLLSSFTIPCVFVLSWLALRARYRWQHRAGAVLCLASLLLLVSTDTAAPRPELVRPLAGDALVLLGALCYACCNVAQEKLLRRGTAVEVLAFFGVFGLLWAGIQASAVEHAELRAVQWTPEVLGLLGGYMGALFAFYSLVPAALRWGGAAALNLGLLTANLWACLARALFLGGFPQRSAVAFAVALVLVTAGLVTYTCGGSIYPTTSSEDCYRVIRPGGHVDGVGHSCVETPRLNGTKPGATPRGGGSAGADGGGGGGGGHGSLRAWLTCGRRAANGEAPAGKGGAGDVEAASLGGEGQGIGDRAGSFWMRPLPSLPIEGALTADPYTKTGDDAARNESAPPVRPA